MWFYWKSPLPRGYLATPLVDNAGSATTCVLCMLTLTFDWWILKCGQCVLKRFQFKCRTLFISYSWMFVTVGMYRPIWNVKSLIVYSAQIDLIVLVHRLAYTRAPCELVTCVCVQVCVPVCQLLFRFSCRTFSQFEKILLKYIKHSKGLWWNYIGANAKAKTISLGMDP